jgi:DNA-binding NarL/FixJ family response regulator
MNGIGRINLKVWIFDTDFYALQQIHSYLAWDRRTRVKFVAETQAQLWAQLRQTPLAERPDVIVLDPDHVGDEAALSELLRQLRATVPQTDLVCLAQAVHLPRLYIAAQAGARAYFLKRDVRLRIASGLVYARTRDFTLTASLAHALQHESNSGERGHLLHNRLFHAAVLPEAHQYALLTDRIRQALLLCVVEGLPAALAADEMGISTHTLRGYVKDGYRVLEADDDTAYPIHMTPQERAFMRLTALEDDETDGES